MRLQQQLAILFPQSTLIVANGSGYDVQIDRPETVIDAVRQMVRTAPVKPWTENPTSRLFRQQMIAEADKRHPVPRAGYSRRHLIAGREGASHECFFKNVIRSSMQRVAWPSQMLWAAVS